MKLKKGDKVKVMVGKDKGKEGPIDRTWEKEDKVSIAGVNIFKRHTKPQAQGKKGGIIEYVRPLPVGNVALICPKCKQVTRVGYQVTAKKKVRLCRKCNQEI
ncbi:50S ribosomal protein L24 [Candidatus Microgenomates bacterium]|nr:50S ribosomal protein L24 [Candidatus Microgenomates bacterium]